MEEKFMPKLQMEWQRESETLGTCESHKWSGNCEGRGDKYSMWHRNSVVLSTGIALANKRMTPGTVATVCSNSLCHSHSFMEQDMMVIPCTRFSLGTCDGSYSLF